jgi:hypothetical protein
MGSRLMFTTCVRTRSICSPTQEKDVRRRHCKSHGYFSNVLCIVTAHLCSYCRVKRFATTSNLYRHMRSCPRNPRKGEANVSAFATIGAETPPVGRHEPRGSAEREQNAAGGSTPSPRSALRASSYGAPDGTLICALPTLPVLMGTIDHEGFDVSINPPYNPTPASILLETRQQLATEFHGSRWDPQEKQISTNVSTSSHREEPIYVGLERTGESLQQSSVHSNLYNTYNRALREDPAQSRAYTEHDGSTFPAYRIAEHSSDPGTGSDDRYVTSPLHVSNVRDRKPTPPRFTYPSTTDVAREATSYLRGIGMPGSPTFRSRDDQNGL